MKDEGHRMKDLLHSSLKFQSRHYLVFHLLSLILYHKQDYVVFNPVSFILYPNSVLNPLSKRHSESKMDEKKDFLKKDTRTLSYATLKNNEEGVSK